MKPARQIHEAFASDQLIEVYREDLDTESIVGYVVGVGFPFFAIAVVSSLCRFDGFICVRLTDVTGCDLPAGGWKVTEAALEGLGVERPSFEGVDVSTVATLVRTAGARFDILALHREVDRPDECEVGKIKTVDEESITWRYISPSAEYDEDVSELNLFELTRVDFGGPYESALAAANKKLFGDEG